MTAFFALLGSASVKAAHRMLMKLTHDVNSKENSFSHFNDETAELVENLITLVDGYFCTFFSWIH